MDAISEEVLTGIAYFRPEEVANTAWSFSKLAVRNKPLLDAISKAAIPTSSEYTATNLAAIAWAFA